ncbi:complement factor D-like [Chironomus tepperi]|uniref:complement factor D-like n=1 Tax=Chironomus tepperi TaxID=113505 RepID=UPI00391F889A
MFRLLLIAAIFSLGVCATVADDSESRILGSTSPASMRQFQHIASLRRAGTNQVHLAGGVMIGENWVLSASSVASLFLTTPTQLLIAFGVINVPTLVAPGFTHVAQEIVLNDGLALIRILTVTCNAARFGMVSAIFMDHVVQPNVISHALVAGWGLTDAGATTALRFRYVLTVHSCANETSLCTTNTLCSADVGGPLVTASGLIGIATSATCGGIDTYARISYYRMWIHVVTGI